jgi:undecaprenyl-diphosphatase
VVGGRFIAFVRSFLGLAAGMAGMPFGDFVVWNAVGATIWGGAFAGLGYIFGRNLPRLERGLAAAGLTLAVLVALIALVTFLVRVAWPRRLEAWAALERGWARVAESPRGLALEHRLPRAWRFVVARFTPTTFLAVHVVVGMLLSLLALWLFGGVLEDVVGGRALMRFDFALARWAHAVATPGGIAVARTLSFLGSPIVLTVLGISVGSRLLFRRQRIPAFGWVASLLGGALLAVALEYVVRRPAPPFPEPFATGAEWSFPSAHALGGLVAYGMLAYLWATLRLEHTASRILAAIAAGVLVLAIGASRLYLGVEYFSDVMGGFAAGAVWLAACVSGVELTWRATESQAGHPRVEVEA